MTGQTLDHPYERARVALVVFSGEADLKWLKILKPGFRHCFIVLKNRRHWVIYNPLSHRTEIAVIEDIPGTDFIDWYREQGYRVVPWTMRPVRLRPAPWGFYTCVEALKRVLGIHSPWVITPWNLYNFLKNKKNRKKSLPFSKNRTIHAFNERHKYVPSPPRSPPSGGFF